MCAPVCMRARVRVPVCVFMFLGMRAFVDLPFK